MKCIRLKYPYVTVMHENRLSYGGSQSWSESPVMRKYGCGVIAGTDVLLYLSLHKEYCRASDFKEKNQSGILDKTEYLEMVKRMRRKYFPVIPGFGMPGWLLAVGMNRYFHAHRIPLKASMGICGKNLWNRVQTMLAHDIPVILAVGQNFPIPRKKHKLIFYKKTGEDYKEACKTAAHFVTVTEMNGKWIKISSWGEEYYISMTEYMEYVEKHSCFLVSNICYLRKK